MRWLKKLLGIRESPGFQKISDKVYLTPNGIVDFDAPKELTPEQNWHNAKLEFEQGAADREFEKNEEYARITGTINMIPRRRVGGIKYVP